MIALNYTLRVKFGLIFRLGFFTVFLILVFIRGKESVQDGDQLLLVSLLVLHTLAVDEQAEDFNPSCQSPLNL
jgi:hypothetical protein